MDIRSAICNLVKTVQNFITDPQLKIQLNELYNLASKPNSKIDDIERLMNNLGKSQTIHNRVVSQPNPLNSSKHSYKIQAQSGASVSAFSNGINQKFQVSEATYREDRQNKTNSDRQICLTSETLTQTPKNQTDVKPFDKLTIDLPPKFKTQSKVHNHCPTVPVISELLEQSQKSTYLNKTLKNEYLKSPKQQSLIIKQYDQQKVSGRVLMVLESCIKEMSQNTFKLILTTEKQMKQILVHLFSIIVHQKIQLQQVRGGNLMQIFKLTTQPLQKDFIRRCLIEIFQYSIKFLMKKLIVKAKQIEKSSPVNPSLDIFLK